jgi:hypothetical protein
MTIEIIPDRFREMMHLSGPAQDAAYKLNREIRDLWKQGIKIIVSVRTDEPLSPYGSPIIDLSLSDRPDDMFHE